VPLNLEDHFVLLCLHPWIFVRRLSLAIRGRAPNEMWSQPVPHQKLVLSRPIPKESGGPPWPIPPCCLPHERQGHCSHTDGRGHGRSPARSHVRPIATTCSVLRTLQPPNASNARVDKHRCSPGPGHSDSSASLASHGHSISEPELRHHRASNWPAVS
jgi:hypothetical protein